jgi:hypothetical protein
MEIPSHFFSEMIEVFTDLGSRTATSCTVFTIAPLANFPECCALKLRLSVKQIPMNTTSIFRKSSLDFTLSY